MRGIVSANKISVGVVVAAIYATFLLTSTVSAQSTIKANLCQDSQVTIAEPPHDGTVNSPLVHFTGTVAYASQIEVYVDNNYSTQIPLSSGQATYASDISISSGTHTIKLVAIGSCTTTSNASASLVVTYVPAKASGPTSTTISETGSKVDSSGSVGTVAPLAGFDKTVKSLASWLNFKVDNQQESQSRLTVVRAVTFGVGLVTTVFGVASLIVDWFSRATAGFLLPAITGGRRETFVRILFRVGGVIIMLLSLFV